MTLNLIHSSSNRTGLDIPVVGKQKAGISAVLAAPGGRFERFKSSPVSPSRFISTARVGGVFRLWSIRRLEKGRAALYPRPARSPGS